MKLHAHMKGQQPNGLEQDGVDSLRLLTEPNDLDEFIEIQAAELPDGSINLVIFGDVPIEGRDSRGNPTFRVWPTAKKAEPTKKTRRI